MDYLLVYILVLVVVVLGAVFIRFILRYRRATREEISELCREWDVPDVPFNMEAAVREVMAGTRLGIPRDGQWWTAIGVEIVGQPSLKRLLSENPAPNSEAVYAGISNIFDLFGGPAPDPPHIPESRFVGALTSIHPDIIIARITGRYRPIGAWVVAVPPKLIGSRA